MVAYWTWSSRCVQSVARNLARNPAPTTTTNEITTSCCQFSFKERSIDLEHRTLCTIFLSSFSQIQFCRHRNCLIHGNPSRFYIAGRGRASWRMSQWGTADKPCQVNFGSKPFCNASRLHRNIKCKSPKLLLNFFTWCGMLHENWNTQAQAWS